MNGLELKEKRKKLGLTQTELAEKVGVAMRTVQNWEKETNKIPKSTELLINDLIRSTEISYLNTPNIVEESNPEYGNREKMKL
jgi:DNA-binding XRE family transcriptional regulator